MLALDDFLYGMTEAGGRKNIGVIFRIALDGSGYEVLHDFTGDEGAIPHSGVVFDGTYLWGMTEREAVISEEFHSGSLQAARTSRSSTHSTGRTARSITAHRTCSAIRSTG